MNDAFNALLNNPSLTPVATPGPAPARGRQNEQTPAVSFSAIVETATKQVRPETNKSAEPPEKKDDRKDTPEELMAMTVMAQQRKPDAITPPETEMEPAEALVVLPDMDVNMLPDFSPVQERPSDVTNLLLMLIKQGDGGNLSDRLEQFLHAQTDLPVDVPQLAEELLSQFDQALLATSQGTEEAGDMGAMTELAEIITLVKDEGTDAEAMAMFMQMRARMVALASAASDRQSAAKTTETDIDATPADGATETLATNAQAVPTVTRPDQEAAQAQTDDEATPDTAFRAATVKPRATENPDSEWSKTFAALPVAGAQTVADVASDTPVEPAQIIRQVVESAAMAHNRNVSQIRIQLNPGVLGRVSIVLTATADGMTARIQTQSDTTRNLLAANVARLQADLKELGVNMKNIEIAHADVRWDMARGGGQLDSGRSGQFQGERKQHEQGARQITLSRFHAAQIPAASAYVDTQSLPTKEDAGVDLRA